MKKNIVLWVAVIMALGLSGCMQTIYIPAAKNRIDTRTHHMEAPKSPVRFVNRSGFTLTMKINGGTIALENRQASRDEYMYPQGTHRLHIEWVENRKIIRSTSVPFIVGDRPLAVEVDFYHLYPIR